MSRVAKCFAAFGRSFEFLTRKEMRLFFIGTATLFFFTFFSPARLSALFGWPDSRTPMGKWVDHSRARSSYCGVFGRYVYDFPRNILRWTVEYEGEPSWGGERDWRIKGCSDRFKRAGFDFKLPNVSLAQQPNHVENNLKVSVSLSQSNNPHATRDMVSHYRGLKVGGIPSGAFDIDVGLHYFDVDLGFRYLNMESISRNRIFWGLDNPSEDDVYISCSIDALVPQCSFHSASSKLGASLVISMAMNHLSDWKMIKDRVEAQLLPYKVQ